MEIQSTVLGNIAVAPRQFKQADINTINEAGKQLRKNGFDDFTEEGIQRNGDSLREYFEANPTVPVTVANIFRAIEARKQDYKWLSPAAVAWYETVQTNLQLGNDLANYVASTSGRPGQLVKDGSDLHFQNLLTLFQEIDGRGESATPQTIAHAQDRILRQPGKGTLHYVPQPRRTEPVSRAAKEDDGTGFLKTGMVRTSDGGWRSKTAAEQAAERRGAEEAQSPSVIRGREQAAAQQEAETMRGSTHSESDQLQKLFVYDQAKQEIDWSATRNARRVMQATFERRRSIR